MLIMVLVKQVPDVAALALDPVSRRLLREGVGLFVNPYDLRALGLARRLKEEAGAEVVVATMGPPAAREALDFARAVTADRCIHVCDPALAGSDSLVTARVLAALVRREGADLVVAGQYSIDSETGQVPEEVAALLGWPCVAAVRELALADGGRTLALGAETEEGMERARAPLPLVVTTAERLIAPPKAEEAALAAAREGPVETLTAADLGIEAATVGEAGSPTVVEAIRTVVTGRSPVMVAAADPAAMAAEAARLVKARWAASAGAAAAADWPEAAGSGGGVWAVVDGSDESLAEAAAELLALARGLWAPVTAVVLAAKTPPGLAEDAIAHGADRALIALCPHLEPPTGEAGAEALESLLDRAGTASPALILAGATRFGRGVLARLAARRGLGLTGDCVGAERGADGRIRWLKPAFGGNVVAPILCRTRPELATLVPGSLRPLARRARSGPVEEVGLALAPPRVRVLGHDRSARAAALALDRAEIVLCLGNAGLGGDDVARVAEAAGAIGRALGAPAAVAATRRVADAGILPRQVQVGMTGRAVAPRLYVGLGVRGAAYHLVGIRHARTVLAVNQDPAAPIFAACDIGIVGDWRALLPALEAALAAG